MSHYIKDKSDSDKMVTKFNQDICNDLCQLYGQGLSQTDCADIVGISRRTLHRWLEKGKNAKSGRYRQFYLQWRKAKAEYKQKHISHINNSSSWLAHQYMLQVVDPDTYVVAEKQQIEQETTATVSADVDMNDPKIHEKDLEMLKNLINDKNGD